MRKLLKRTGMILEIVGSLVFLFFFKQHIDPILLTENDPKTLFLSVGSSFMILLVLLLCYIYSIRIILSLANINLSREWRRFRHRFFRKLVQTLFLWLYGRV